MSTPFRHRPDHRAWLRAERQRLLDFSRAAAVPTGFAWLDRSGTPEADRPVALFVTCRMTHCYALGAMAGVPGCAPLADHGLRALTGHLRDPEHGGWFATAPVGDVPPPASKAAYDHAFVVLASATASMCGRPGADALLSDAVDVLLSRFWDDRAGMLVDEWDRTFTILDDYRGINANMHAVEALLAAADALAEPELRQRALTILTRVVHVLAPAHSWRIPEHFDPAWRPLLDYHQDQPAHPFRPYGATVGHWFEWARLAVQLGTALGDEAPEWLVDDASALFDAAVREGWAADGADGFLYTVDWSGRPVVRERMHWVAAEALAAAATLHEVTGEARYDAWYATVWDHVAAHMIDREGGSWWHELSPELDPSASTWPGKPDLYHALQATLIPEAPLASSVARGLLGT